MPETPKSFEEVDAHLTRIFEMQNLVESPDGTRITLGQFIRNKLAEKDAEIARLRATQPTQTAAVPARQDAVPDNRTSVGCEARGHTWNTYNPAWATKCIVCGFEPPAVRSTLPPQTAVGEGELPYLDKASELLVFHYGNFTYDSVAAFREEAERIVREAIAQRDEATQACVTLNRERADFEAQRDQAREERDMHVARVTDKVEIIDEQAETISKLVDTLEAAEAKLAALDVPKPEGGEIERLKKAIHHLAAYLGWDHPTVAEAHEVLRSIGEEESNG